MKIILYSMVLGFALLLIGCGSGAPLSQTELFQLKKECAAQEKEVQKVIASSVERFAGNTSLQHSESLKEIFYSPKRNSCLFLASASEYQNSEFCYYYKIYDLYAKDFEEVILVQDGNAKCNSLKTMEALDKVLKELKAE